MLKSMLFGTGKLYQGDPWVASLGGSNSDQAQSVAVAPDGSVYVCGNTSSAGAGDFDFLLAKFNESGAVQWKKTLVGSSDDRGMSVAVAPDGSVYICGYTSSVGAGDYNFLLAKFNESGAVQWKKTLGGSRDDSGRSVAVAPDGSVYVCGYTSSVGVGSSDLLLAKFNESGTVQWKKTLGGSNVDQAKSVAVAPDGSVYVCGSTSSVGVGDYDLLLAKFNESGTVQWKKTLSGGNSDEGTSVAVAPDGSVYVCGSTKSVGAGSHDFLLAKFNESGAVQWKKTLGGRNTDQAQSVAVAPDGSVYVCGYTSSVGVGSSDLLLAKFNESGAVQWKKTLGGSSDDLGMSVAVAPDGSVYVCGYTSSVGAGDYDLLLAKITDSLIEKSTATFGDFTFKNAELTLKNASLTSTSPELSDSEADLNVNNASLTLKNASLTATLYTESK